MEPHDGDQLLSVRQAFLRRNRRISITLIVCGTVLVGVPVLILHSDAGIFACLVGAFLGFLVAKARQFLIPERRKAWRQLNAPPQGDSWENVLTITQMDKSEEFSVVHGEVIVSLAPVPGGGMGI